MSRTGPPAVGTGTHAGHDDRCCEYCSAVEDGFEIAVKHATDIYQRMHPERPSTLFIATLNRTLWPATGGDDADR